MVTRVTKQNLLEVIERINQEKILVFDCETTGLKPYHDSNMFSLALADLNGNAWYFNFKPYQHIVFHVEQVEMFHVEHPDDYVLRPEDLKPIMKKQRAWVAHNAKFDLHFTEKAGIAPVGRIHDTEVLARLFENHHQYTGGYSLSACTKRWLPEKFHKDDRVKKWMDENGAFGLYGGAEGREEKHYYFDLVPYDLISEYAPQDCLATGALYLFLLEKIYETNLIEVESDLVPVLFHVEHLGVKLDREYAEKAYEYESSRVKLYESELRNLCDGEFTDSALFLSERLEKRGFVIPATEKGNPQLTDEVLRQKEDPLAQAVLGFRDAQKRATTYWANYLILADEKDVIHPNFRQSGTTTGRMSCNSPNLQNIPAEDGGPFPIRRAFIPRAGFKFLSIDFDAMEFKLLCDYAGDLDLIEKIKFGHDPHQATADLTGLLRPAAKTLNFMIIYGGGYKKIAQALGVDEFQAKRFKYKYFDALPGVKYFIREAVKRLESRGYSFNWAGRRYVINDLKYSYKTPNYIIQGGAADIVKIAMVRLAEFLKNKKTRMVLQIHDEICFELADDEHHIIPELKKIMAEAYPYKHLPMTCSASIGDNLYDLEDVK